MPSLKSMAASFMRYIQVDLASFEDNYKKTVDEYLTLAAIQYQKRELEEIWDKISTRYEWVRESELMDDPEKAATINIDELTREYAKAKSLFRSRIISIDAALAEATRLETLKNSPPTPSTPPTPVTHSAPSSSFSVPPCDMQDFHGDYKSWTSFRDMFKAIYGNNSRLSGVEKLFYLKQKTRGEAKEIVDSAPLTNDGFVIAWTLLTSQYENKRMQINAQLKTLFNLPYVNVQCGVAIRKLQRKINSCISNLNTLDIDTDNWDPIFVYLCSSKLPKETLEDFEKTLRDSSNIPCWTEMDIFLTNTYKGLESVNDIKNPNTYPRNKQNSDSKNQNERKGNTFVNNVTQEPKKDTHAKRKPQPEQNPSNSTRTQNTSKLNGSVCKLCKANHTLRDCPSFISMGVAERINFVKQNGCCYNCLAISHGIKECHSTFTCRHCGGRHNSLLHRPSSNSNTHASTNSNPTDEQPSTSTRNVSQSFSTLTNQTDGVLDDRKKLLGTAVLNVQVHGSLFPARALIDPASDFSFISDQFRRKLHIPTQPIIAEISGLNEVVSARSNKMCEVTLRSNTQRNFSLEIQAIVVKTLTRTLPTQSINPNIIKDLEQIQLADPRFYESRPIDFIIGSDFYPQILKSGVKKDFLNTLIAQDTEFGWILTGPVEETHRTQTIVSYFSAVTLNKCLTKFWEIEEIPQKPIKSVEETVCENIFTKTTQRLPNGRYQVDLPFRTPQLELGNSRHVAMAQYLRNEKNLMKNPTLKSEYDNALQEYVDLGHMKAVNFNPNSSSTTYYYLPHHAVVKPDRVTTKVRVVFNASSKTSNGNSLNDALFIGPTLQQDLSIVILKWRFYKIVFNADITKMYRQILLNTTHTPFQRILFRKSVNEPIKDYELQTVTFGVNCAPYLAIRTLLELAKEVETTHPIASHILKNNMYVDDVLSGAHTIEDAKFAQNEMITVLDSAGFPLRKWISNSPDLLNILPKDHLLDVDLLTLPDSHNTKTLGIRWNAKEDFFFFSVPTIEKRNAYTKRSVLSDIARLFDPAGWLAPIVVSAKIIMQQVWQDNTDWDECLKPLTLTKWLNFLKFYDDINKIRIPRWINFKPTSKIEFHGFSDASEKAYSAVLYVRVTPIDGPNIITLLFAKTRVAPIKVLSIPRLELCGAVLLANMVNNVLTQLKLPLHQVYFWTDSTIVLAWLSKHPKSWETFVAHRVATISDTVGVNNWNHVVSHENPAVDVLPKS
ncbi:uncharacterized protein LOC135949900 [Calliphora vicina]|uniref:uncharacterized protein LOC135949900 n=1 Tax=Calliphora vicina TaxID=7373 RepID=UPI00325AB99E